MKRYLIDTGKGPIEDRSPALSTHGLVLSTDLRVCIEGTQLLLLIRKEK